MAEMDQEQLLRFIQQICKATQGEGYVRERLEQLLQIMQMQNVPVELTLQLRRAINDLAEVVLQAKGSPVLTEKGLEAAHRRADERRRREEESRHYGRC